jgi:hypothetical protein
MGYVLVSRRRGAGDVELLTPRLYRHRSQAYDGFQTFMKDVQDPAAYLADREIYITDVDVSGRLFTFAYAPAEVAGEATPIALAVAGVDEAPGEVAAEEAVFPVDSEEALEELADIGEPEGGESLATVEVPAEEGIFESTMAEPAEEAEAPVEEAEAPAEEAEAPAEEAVAEEAPVEEAAAPSEETDAGAAERMEGPQITETGAAGLAAAWEAASAEGAAEPSDLIEGQTPEWDWGKAQNTAPADEAAQATAPAAGATGELPPVAPSEGGWPEGGSPLETPETDFAAPPDLADTLGITHEADESEGYVPDSPLDLSVYTCHECVFYDTCPKRGQEKPSDCGSFQWRAGL